jgi:dihydroneopterin triphosphate diphosphatase
MTLQNSPKPPKIPLSVLVVIYTQAGEVLLIERAKNPGFWQSVTGSLDALDEVPANTAQREVLEETGIDSSALPGAVLSDWHLTNTYEIFAHWRHRYAPGVTQNTEFVFGLCLPARVSVTLAPDEHIAYQWLHWKDAAERCFSWSNSAAIKQLGVRLAS